MAPSTTSPAQTSTQSSPLSTMSPPPSIPISTSTNYTSTSLPQATQIALLSHLRTINAIPELASTLHDSLSRTGWTDRIRSLALELLRSGTCTTYPELLSEVLRRAKVPKPEAPTTNGVDGKGVNGTGASKTTNGVNGSGSSNHTAGNRSISVREGWFDEDGLPDVRIPAVTVEAGVEFLKERIADVTEVVDEDDDSD